MAIEQGRRHHDNQLDKDAIELNKSHSKRQVIQNEFDPLVNCIRHVTEVAGYHYGCQGAPLRRALRLRERRERQRKERLDRERLEKEDRETGRLAAAWILVLCCWSCGALDKLLV